MVHRILFLSLAFLAAAPEPAGATVAVNPLYGSNMVIQRGKAFPIRGTAAPNRTITVAYNSQTNSTTSDAQGNWLVSLPAMGAKTNGSNLTIAETGGNTITLNNVVVGDVWLCSGQSNMAWGMSRLADINSANFPGIRSFSVPLANLGEPSQNLTGSWLVCSPSTASSFSAVAFYFGRKIYQDQTNNIPVGLIVSSVGGTCIDPWLAPEGCTDIPDLAPLYSQSILAWGPFALFNGMIYPLAPYPMKGAIWYQGENRETTSQSNDSYFLKEKALQQGWKRLLGLDDFAFYAVLLANWGTINTSATPDTIPGGTWADTRIQQVNVVGLPHAGVASALDVGDPVDIHPADKLDVGERLALWALKNDYGRSTIVPSGPILKDVTVSGTNLICSFDYVGAGLMVGIKTNYLPTVEVVGGVLTNFSISGASGSWFAATASINTNNNTVTVCSPYVAAPRRVAYACWQSPAQLNFYNRDGLPANPFYVDDASAKYTVTASAGPGGSISPAGANSYLKRMTALYTITPDAGNYIQDVKVDGVSIGAVKNFTFDPLYASHTIAATFTNVIPSYTIAATPRPGGLLSPTGAVIVAHGGTQAFGVTPNPGCLVSLAVDGRPMGARTSFGFADVNANHSIAPAFSCAIKATSGYGGSISSPGTTNIPYGSNMTYTITPAATYAILKVMVDGTNMGAVASYTFTNVTTSHAITASFTGGSGGGSVPQTNQLLFSCLVDSLPSSGSISSWPAFIPSSPALSPIGSPTVVTNDGRKFAQNNYYDYDGFNQGVYASPIACNGATIVVVAKPSRNGVSSGWNSLVDAFYDRLVLGIKNDNGQVCVRRNGSVDTSSQDIPDGQTTILSLVVQPNGTYKVWANGSLIYNNGTISSLTGLTNGVAGGFANNITVGRNWPDGWTTFNGDIGDVFFYKTALSDADRLSLEQYLAFRLVGASVTNYTITASAGAGGSIAPSGTVLVVSNASQTFGIAPNVGFAVAQVSVDGVNQGAITNYTFTNVVSNHTISATFVALPTFTITAAAGTGGTITPSGAVSVVSNANQTFSITPGAGYNISQVSVDSTNQGAIGGYTFTNVIASHTITASFTNNGATNYTINASAGTGGSISPNGAVSVLGGSNQSFVITASSGFAISSVLVDAVSQGALSSYTFTNVTSSHSISATFTNTPALSQGGVISVNFCQAGDILPSTAVAGIVPTNRWNSIVWGGGTSYSNPTNVFYDCTGASVSPFTVTLSVSGMDTWNSGNVSQPNPTLYADWALPGGGTLTFANIPYANYDLYVYFNGYNGVNVVNYTIGTNTQTLTDSANFAYQFTPPFVQGTDYVKFTGLTNRNPVMTVAGVSGGFSYGLAAFQLVQSIMNYTISASAGSGGTISPSGGVLVGGGSNLVFTITASAGYSISNVLVDDVSRGPISSYTFTNVTANHTISASFASLPPPTLAIAPNGTGGIDITWPDTYAGTLVTSPVLGPGASWIPVGSAPAHIGTLYKFTVTPGATNAFYGLSY